jgi:DNA-binding winged helix-turn-helix (wHTH) protein/tetratricopeptide (TPR) repeat protein
VRARFDRFELDEANATLTCDGKPIALPPTPFAVLCALVRQQGGLVTKNGLLDEVWGHRFVTESVLKTVIGKLRTALQDDAKHPRFIETVSRRGYRFIASTVPTGRTGWARDAQPAVPGGDDFIARAHELARLGAAWDGACHGKRSILWLAGDPGIGKTTLIEHFVASLGDIACVRGQCVEQYGAGEPYLPVLEALAELCRRDAAAVAMLRSVAPAWLVQLPWLTTAEERDVLRRELAGLGADRMLREMAEFVDRYTERAPLLLVTEDLHWSDRSTIQLLDYCARRRGGARFMWLASFRLSEVIALDHPLNRLRRELLLHGLCEELVLDPFSESEVAQYVARRSPSTVADEAFIRALHERTDGLPLFVDQILSDVAETAQDGESALAATQIAALAVPERLAALIDHYIVRLPNEERMVLSAAAVCGTEFRVDTIALVLESDRATTAQACEELARKRLLIAVTHAQGAGPAQPSYSFRHALFRQVLYERTSAALRMDLHRRAGSALERERAAGVPIAAAELALHFERGGDAAAAAGHYTEAAESALLHYSPGEGLMLADRGLRVLDQAAPAPERDILEISLATIAGASAGHLLGESSPEAKAWLQRAHALLEKVPGHPMRATLLHLLGVALFARGEYAEAISVAERTQALSSVTSDVVLLRAACTIEGQVRMLQGRPRVAREWFERGLAAVASSEAPTARDSLVADPQVTLLGLLALQLLHVGCVETAQQRIAQAQQRARESAQPVAQMIAVWCDALLEVRLGNAQRVEALAAQMGMLVETYALGLGRTVFSWLRGWALARTGRPAEGFSLIREAYEQNVRLGMLSGGSEVLGYGAEALLLAGDLEAAEAQLAEAFRVAETLGERIYLPELFVIEASLARTRGKPRDAEAALRRALAEAREQQAPWLELAPLAELCAARGASRGDREELAALIDRMPEAKHTQAVARARAILAKR